MASKTRQSLNKILRPLASMRLAVVVLGLLAVVLAVATVIESKAGSSVAQRAVYHAAWFDLLLGLLAVNVAAAAIIRWPWRLKQVGFVITHLGILVVLGGCLTTRWFGAVGRVILTEGSQDNHLVQDGWQVEAEAQAPGKVQVDVDDPPRIGAVSHFEAGGQPYQMRIIKYYENAQAGTRLIKAKGDEPAAALVELRLPGSSMGNAPERSMQQWLLTDDAGQWSIRSPGFSLMAVSHYTPPESPAASQPAKGTLVLNIGGKDYEVDVEHALAGSVAVADGHTTVHVADYYEHATVGAGGKMTDEPGRPVNPAVIVQLTHNNQTEKRIVFARFGDISAMHGGAKDNPVKVSFRHSMANAGKLKVVLVPIQPADSVSEAASAQGKWTLYEENGGRLVQQAEVQPGSEVTLKGMAVTLEIKQSLAHATPARSVTPKAAGAGGDPQPALRVEVRGPGGTQQDWLAWGQPAVFEIGKNAVEMTLQARQAKLPFAIRLDKFELDKYPGTDMPSMYRSKVTVLDNEAGVQMKFPIEMNRPLEYRGWTFFQSSYTSSGGRRVSILSASKDPGKPVVYTGCILLILGTLVMAVQRLMATPPVAARKGDAARTGQQEARQPAGAGRSKPNIVSESDHA